MPVNTLFADTATIRLLGGAYTAHAADLAAVASALNAIPAPELGPVGARFLAAFTDALADHRAAVAALSADSTVAASAARSNADVYDAAGQRAGNLLPRV